MDTTTDCQIMFLYSLCTVVYVSLTPRNLLDRVSSEDQYILSWDLRPPTFPDVHTVSVCLLFPDLQRCFSLSFAEKRCKTEKKDDDDVEC